MKVALDSFHLLTQEIYMGNSQRPTCMGKTGKVLKCLTQLQTIFISLTIYHLHAKLRM